MRWLITLFAVVLLSACASASGASDASGDRDLAPERSAADLATVRAQAGVDAASPTARSVPATPTPRQPTATVETREQNPGYATDETLFDALLLPQDISTKWTMATDDGIGSAAFCGALSIEDQFEPIGWAYGSYSAVGGEWAEQWVVRLLEPDAEAAMAYARAALTCDDETYPDASGNDVHWDYEPLALAAIGDDLHAVRATITYANPAYTPMDGTIVFVRSGEYMVVLLHYGFSTDPALTAQMAEVAAARLELIRDTTI
jgi:hypothetical protein